MVYMYTLLQLCSCSCVFLTFPLIIRSLSLAAYCDSAIRHVMTPLYLYREHNCTTCTAVKLMIFVIEMCEGLKDGEDGEALPFLH